VVRAKGLLEDIGGVAVKGYRAPSFSIGTATCGPSTACCETGHRYSSSIYPIAHDHYGMPDAPRFATRRASKGLLEVPVTTLRLFNRNLPSSGGGYFRLLPYACRAGCCSACQPHRRAKPAIFYFHPWEIDPASRASRHRCQDALSPLREHRPHEARCAALLVTSAGAAWMTFFSASPSARQLAAKCGA
jgi:polysaccharide deacetylase family protein (PEP-CTERM system associated)